MLRFIALAWHASDSQASDSASIVRRKLLESRLDWSVVVDSDCLFVACIDQDSRSEQVIALPGGQGAVLGTLFDYTYQDGNSLRELRSAEMDELIASGGRSAFRRFWGSFVVMVRDRQDCSSHVLRSPMAHLGCFYVHWRGTTAIFSAVDDWASLGLMKLTINWDCIRAQACNRDFVTRETGFTEMTALETGERLTVGLTGNTILPVWTPGDISRSEPIESFAAASDALQTETRRCVCAWASLHDNILHTLSGGLDSSIVLCCLRQMRTAPRVTCLNQFSREIVGDERRYARSMAEKHGTQLLEIQRDPDVSLTRFLDCARTERPVLHFTGCDSYPTAVRVARMLGASVIFDGELGDSLYGCSIGQECVAEYIWRHGYGPDLLPVAFNLAVLKRLSVWRVIRRATAYCASMRKSPDWSIDNYASSQWRDDPMENGLISKDALDAYRCQHQRFIHPWFRDTEGVPLGRILLIYALFVKTSSVYRQPFAGKGDPQVVSPLASQPLVECALRIETHLNFQQGIDRAAARNAFSGSLSDLVLSRSGKATPSGWIQEVVRRNRAFLRETLLDGILLKHGILDARRVAGVLDGSTTNSPVRATDVFIQLYIEAWLRRWHSSGSISASP